MNENQPNQPAPGTTSSSQPVTPGPGVNNDSTFPWQVALAAFLGVVLLVVLIGIFRAKGLRKPVKAPWENPKGVSPDHRSPQ